MWNTFIVENEDLYWAVATEEIKKIFFWEGQGAAIYQDVRVFALHIFPLGKSRNDVPEGNSFKSWNKRRKKKVELTK